MPHPLPICKTNKKLVSLHFDNIFRIAFQQIFLNISLYLDYDKEYYGQQQRYDFDC